LYFIPHFIGTLITGVSLAVGGVFREHRTFSFRSVVFTFICCPFSFFCILFSYSRHSTLSFRNPILFRLRFNGYHHRINKPQHMWRYQVQAVAPSPKTTSRSSTSRSRLWTQGSLPAHLRTEMVCGAPRHLQTHDASLDLTGGDRFPKSSKRRN
jgi:hypothetical protein